MKRIAKLLCTILLTVCSTEASAQIGYQVALLNSATGEPRANESVSVGITITNNQGGTVYTQTQRVTSNDFGMLTLSIGNANTFKEVDWNKLPFFIEVTANGVSLAKSQILNVPVAEYAKQAGFVLTPEYLEGKWEGTSNGSRESYIFNKDKTCTRLDYYYNESENFRELEYTWNGTYSISFNCLVIQWDDGYGAICVFSPETGVLWEHWEDLILKKQ